jgi:RimJ/RimL family protein N-acetyltransferase
MPLEIASENFVLRSLVEDDIGEQYHSWFADSELMEHFGGGSNQSIDQLRRFLTTFNNSTRFHIGIFANDTTEFIGYYYVYVDYYRSLARTAVLIGEREYWGKGVVIETRSCLLDFVFDKLKMERVWGWVDTRNIPAVFNYQVQGFQCEGILRGHGTALDGSRVDQYVFGILADGWRARRTTKNEKER